MSCPVRQSISKEDPPRLRRLLFHIFIYLLLDILSFSSILPWTVAITDAFVRQKDVLFNTLETAVQYMASLFTDKPVSVDSVLLGGILASSLSMIQFLTSPFIGRMSDDVGRRPVLIFLQFIGLLQYTIWLVGSNGSLTLFTVSRLLSGLSRAKVAVLTASIGDCIPEGVRTRAMAVIGLAYSVGFTLGPPLSTLAIGALIDRRDLANVHRLLASASLVIELLGLAQLYWLVGETRSIDATSQTTTSALLTLPGRLQNSLTNPLHLFAFTNFSTKEGDKVLSRLSLIWFGFIFVFSGFDMTLLFLARERFGYSSADNGRIFFFVGLVMMLIQGGFIRRFQHGNELRLSLLAVCALLTAAIALSLAHSQLLFWFGLLSYALASAIFIPGINGVVSLVTQPDKQGITQGRFRSLNALARATGPTLFAFVFWSIGSCWCFLVYGLVLLLVLVLLYRVDNKSVILSRPAAKSD